MQRTRACVRAAAASGGGRGSDGGRQPMSVYVLCVCVRACCALSFAVAVPCWSGMLHGTGLYRLWTDATRRALPFARSSAHTSTEGGRQMPGASSGHHAPRTRTHCQCRPLEAHHHTTSHLSPSKPPPPTHTHASGACAPAASASGMRASVVGGVCRARRQAPRHPDGGAAGGAQYEPGHAAEGRGAL